jgi:hypothetical protein
VETTHQENTEEGLSILENAAKCGYQRHFGD